MKITCHKIHQTGGYTLVEMVIAAAVSATMMMLAAVAFVNVYKLYMIERIYRDIHEDARMATMRLNNDIRAGISLTNRTGASLPTSVAAGFATNFLVIVRPRTDNTNQMEIIHYGLSNTTVKGFSQPVAVLWRKVYTNTTETTPLRTEMITRNPIQIDFTFYKDPGQQATSQILSDTYEVRVFLVVSNHVLNQAATDRIQVRASLRNKNLYN